MKLQIHVLLNDLWSRLNPNYGLAAIELPKNFAINWILLQSFFKFFADKASQNVLFQASKTIPNSKHKKVEKFYLQTPSCCLSFHFHLAAFNAFFLFIFLLLIIKQDRRIWGNKLISYHELLSPTLKTKLFHFVEHLTRFLCFLTSPFK